MSETRNPYSQPHVTTHTPPDSVPRRSSTTGRKSWLKLMAVPLGLLAASIGLGVAGLMKFQWATQESPGTSFPHIVIDANKHPIFAMQYDIYQLSRARSVMKISIDMGPDAPRTSTVATVSALAPVGASFICPKSSKGCSKDEWDTSVNFHHNGYSTTAALYLKVAHLGIDYSGSEVSAALPTVFIEDMSKPTRAPVLFASYYLPSVQHYDWADSPPDNVVESKGRVQWEEALNPNGFTTGRSIVGTNHFAADHRENNALMAGVLFGLAGAAFVGAVVEIVHARDWETLRAVRRQ